MSHFCQTCWIKAGSLHSHHDYSILNSLWWCRGQIPYLRSITYLLTDCIYDWSHMTILIKLITSDVWTNFVWTLGFGLVPACGVTDRYVDRKRGRDRNLKKTAAKSQQQQQFAQRFNMSPHDPINTQTLLPGSKRVTQCYLSLEGTDGPHQHTSGTVGDGRLLKCIL